MRSAGSFGWFHDVDPGRGDDRTDGGLRAHPKVGSVPWLFGITRSNGRPAKRPSSAKTVSPQGSSRGQKGQGSMGNQGQVTTSRDFMAWHRL